MSQPFPFDPAQIFGIAGELLGVEPLTSGHINRTYKLQFPKTSIVLQKVNTAIFRDIDGLMGNIFTVTEYLRTQLAAIGGDVDREGLHFLRTVDGALYYQDAGGGSWRAYRFVANSYTVQKIDRPETFTRAGRAFGRFGRLLTDFDGASLAENLPDFHNTPVRFAQLQEAVKQNAAGRKDSALPEINFAAEREEQYGRLVVLQAEDKLPVRVTHNDTKLNNVVFDKLTGGALCVIDLDTVMPGLSAYDFGDAIRFGANTAAEDERDISKVSLNLELFAAYAKGYLSEAGSSLTQTEREVLPFGAWLMTVECGMRFLADYLNGDIYFHTDYPEHNLVRARTQFALAADMERKMGEMERIVSEFSLMHRLHSVTISPC
ncbi:MAG: aminoglycoside phosphotransferase family protein [Oscillospiraceae bacterium]|jgi:Ser/Thr protein kinase RdoA (MazF antagonist)|nr:aminoglycoside phosphotransferase family protein [Oscillospiraceae bacterium]